MRLVLRARMPVIALVCTFFAAGCGKDGGKLTENEAHLKALTVMYGKYLATHRQMGPNDDADFRKFVKSFPAGELEGLRIDANDLDKTFVSPRDKQPYGVAYKTRPGAPGASGAGPMILWEQTGANGKRMVADSMGKIEEIDEAEFNKRFSALGIKK